MGYPDSIKVHVTPHQRETLEFLVNRRLHDIINAIHRNLNVTAVQLQTWEAEIETLRALKTELGQAGT
jgi:hypothetical protein